MRRSYQGTSSTTAKLSTIFLHRNFSSYYFHDTTTLIGMVSKTDWWSQVSVWPWKPPFTPFPFIKFLPTTHWKTSPSIWTARRADQMNWTTSRNSGSCNSDSYTLSSTPTPSSFFSHYYSVTSALRTGLPHTSIRKFTVPIRVVRRTEWWLQFTKATLNSSGSILQPTLFPLPTPPASCQ
jgi:hypothetical protein